MLARSSNQKPRFPFPLSFFSSLFFPSFTFPKPTPKNLSTHPKKYFKKKKKIQQDPSFSQTLKDAALTVGSSSLTLFLECCGELASFESLEEVEGRERGEAFERQEREGGGGGEEACVYYFGGAFCGLILFFVFCFLVLFCF